MTRVLPIVPTTKRPACPGTEGLGNSGKSEYAMLSADSDSIEWSPEPSTIPTSAPHPRKRSRAALLTDYAAEMGGAESGFLVAAITSGRSESSGIGVIFVSCLG